MADNTTLPGTGDVIADDDIGGVKFQRMKLIHGADGVNDGDVSKDNPLPVGGNLISVTVEITRPADTTAYAAGDSVGDSTSAITMQQIANAARVSGGSGYIVGMRIASDQKSITPRFRVHTFNTNGATISNDNAAWQDRYADVSKRVAFYDMPAMTTAADATNSTMARSVDMTMRIPYVCAATSLYFDLETLDALTPASGGKFSVTFVLDRN